MITAWFGAASGACWKTSPTWMVVGEAGDGEESIKLAKELHPKVMVMDCALPGHERIGGDAQDYLDDSPDTAVLMLSMHSESTWVRQADRGRGQGIRAERTRWIWNLARRFARSPREKRCSIRRSSSALR